MALEIRDGNLDPSNQESVLRACDLLTGICLPSVNVLNDFGTNMGTHLELKR